MRSEATNTLRLCIVLCVLSLPAEAASQTPQELCASSLGEGRSQDGSARIAWARDRSLTWTDFQAKAPAQAVEAAGSCVGFGVSWECVDAGITFVVKAAFDPAQSWVRAGSETDALLRHEQTHFDLTELFARRLRKQFTQGLHTPLTPAAVSSLGISFNPILFARDSVRFLTRIGRSSILSRRGGTTMVTTLIR